MTMNHSDVSSNEFLLENLVGGETYEVDVRAATTVGLGDFAS